MRRTTWLAITTATLFALLTACSSRNAGSSGASGLFSCTATGTVASGNIATAGSTVELSGLTVQILNGSSGPFNISVDSANVQSSSSPTYTYPSLVPAIAGVGSTLSSTVSVEDMSTANIASCSITTGSNQNLGTSIQITASTTSAALNTPITVTASASGVTNPSFTFSLVTPTNGVTITTLSATQVSVTSTVNASVNIVATLTTVVSGIAQQSAPLTLTFGAGGTVSTGSLTCELVHYSGNFYVGSPVVFLVLTNTGEPVQITQLNPGESWSGSAPTMPLTPPVGLNYQDPGLKSVSVIAESTSRPGTFCNNGAELQDEVYVQGAGITPVGPAAGSVVGNWIDIYGEQLTFSSSNTFTQTTPIPGIGQSGTYTLSGNTVSLTGTQNVEAGVPYAISYQCTLYSALNSMIRPVLVCVDPNGSTHQYEAY